jgi:hypothetical protein
MSFLAPKISKPRPEIAFRVLAFCPRLEILADRPDIWLENPRELPSCEPRDEIPPETPEPPATPIACPVALV